MVMDEENVKPQDAPEDEFMEMFKLLSLEQKKIIVLTVMLSIAANDCKEGHNEIL